MLPACLRFGASQELCYIGPVDPVAVDATGILCAFHCIQPARGYENDLASTLFHRRHVSPRVQQSREFVVEVRREGGIKDVVAEFSKRRT